MWSDTQFDLDSDPLLSEAEEWGTDEEDEEDLGLDGEIEEEEDEEEAI